MAGKKTEKRQIIPAPQKLENVNKLGGLAPEVENQQRAMQIWAFMQMDCA